MKKGIALICVFMLFFLNAAAEAINKEDFCGTWVYEEETLNNGFLMESFHLTSDFRVFYIYETMKYNGATNNYKFTGTWELNEEDITISLDTGSNTKYIAKYKPDGSLHIYNALSGWVKTKKYMKPMVYGQTKPQHMQDGQEDIDPVLGVSVPEGVYYIGQHIKPGAYVISAGESLHVRVAVSRKGDVIKLADLSSLDDDNSLITVQLQENDYLYILNDSAIIENLNEYF